MYDVKVEDVMTNLVVSMQPGDSVHDAATRLARNNISGAPVIEDGKVVGVVSEADLIRAVMPPVPVDHGASILDLLSILTRAKPHERDHGKTVADVMNTKVISVRPGQSIWSAAILMDRHDVKRLPVVDEEGYLLGIISRADLIKTMARSDDTIRKDVVEAVGMLGEETITDFEVEVADAVVHLEGTADRRSTHEAAVKLAGRVPGVVEIVDRMDHEREDVVQTHDRIARAANWNADIPVIEGRR